MNRVSNINTFLVLAVFAILVPKVGHSSDQTPISEETAQMYRTAAIIADVGIIGVGLDQLSQARRLIGDLPRFTSEIGWEYIEKETLRKDATRKLNQLTRILGDRAADIRVTPLFGTGDTWYRSVAHSLTELDPQVAGSLYRGGALGKDPLSKPDPGSVIHKAFVKGKKSVQDFVDEIMKYGEDFYGKTWNDHFKYASLSGMKIEWINANPAVPGTANKILIHKIVGYPLAALGGLMALKDVSTLVQSASSNKDKDVPFCDKDCDVTLSNIISDPAYAGQAYENFYNALRAK